MRRLGLGLLVLFPQAWRERYELEMRALLAEQVIRPRTLVDLMRAAVDAHLHPDGLRGAPLERMRGTVGAALCCWIAFVVCGSGFAKLTEDRSFAAAAMSHPLLAGARMAVVILAALSLAAVLLGGARLIAELLHEAWTERRRPLVRAASAPLAAVAVCAATTAVLAWLVGGGRLPAHSGGAWIALLAWLAIGLGGAAVCGLAPRAALRHAHPRPAALRGGVRGAVALAILLALTTAATAVYAVAVAIDVPSLAAAPNGPFRLVSTTAGLAALVVLMATISALAAITGSRGLRALRALG
jgi:hypothetical protein